MRRAAVVVLCGIIGLAGWRACRSILRAVERGRMKRTMGDMRTVATAIESWSIDHRAYPVGVGDAADLAPLLEPTYVRRTPRLDGWGSPLRYASDGTDYVVASRGGDLRWAPDQEPGGISDEALFGR